MSSGHRRATPIIRERATPMVLRSWSACGPRAAPTAREDAMPAQEATCDDLPNESRLLAMEYRNGVPQPDWEPEPEVHTARPTLLENRKRSKPKVPVVA